MVSGKAGRLKTQKPCARLRDADREAVAVSASGDPAMVFRSKMASILPMVRAFYPLSPSRRIAAGHAAWALSPRAYKMHDLDRKTGRPLFRIMQKTRADARVNS